MGRRKTREEFIEQANKVHNGIYDYSEVEYVNNYTKVIIICPEHGEFEQPPKDHLRGQGCPNCHFDKIRKTTEQFIEESNKVHNGIYDYSEVEYVNNCTKVKIICSEHGEFEQRPNGHLSGRGCPICSGNKRKTREQFIEEANKVHNGIYDYSDVEYVNSKIKVIIICSEHGEFEQAPKHHLSGRGCPNCCYDKQRKTREQFIEEVNKVHNGIYDYSEVEYVNNKIKVIIICSEHGKFEQKPSHHLRGAGCPICSNIRKTTEQFIEESNKVHNGIYDYSKVEYVHSRTKIKIICSEHGEFEQEPNGHLNGNGCPNCCYDKQRKTREEFIEEANKVHNGIYDYSKVDYVLSFTKVIIICSEHGEFEQAPSHHLSGRGCPNCHFDKIRKTTEQFIEEANKVHNGIYDYSKVEYVNSKIKVIIRCPEHGEFEQKPSSHLRGVGCPICKSSKGEMLISDILKTNNIEFETEYTFKDCKHKYRLRFDFYLPEYNMCIEYDGRQHFEDIEYFGGKKQLKIIQTRDRIKNEYCKENNIDLIRVNYKHNDDEIKNILMEKIHIPLKVSL